MLASWAPKPQSSYNAHLKHWRSFCATKDINTFKASFDEAMGFIDFLFDKKKATYGQITATRSALSAILPKKDNVSFGKCPDVCRMIKGIFKSRPSLPRHTVIYDANVILNYMISLTDNKELDLETLTKKLTTFLCLLSGQRAQTIGALQLDVFHYDDKLRTFYIPTILKTTRPGKHQEPLTFHKFETSKLCVLRCFEEYRLGQRKSPRLTKELDSLIYLSTSSSEDSYANEICEDVLRISRHRHYSIHMPLNSKASTSKANNLGLSLKDINKAAGWFSESTFSKLYKLNIVASFSKTLQQGC